MSTSTNEAVSVEAPRSGRISPKYARTAGGKGNFEMLAWLFMRVSGAILIVLIFTSKKSRAPKAEGIPYDKGSR